MKVSKAIEILERHHWAAVCQLRQEGAATQLGIEALKRIHKERGGVAPLPGRYLPGETPEEEVKS